MGRQKQYILRSGDLFATFQSRLHTSYSRRKERLGKIIRKDQRTKEAFELTVVSFGSQEEESIRRNNSFSCAEQKNYFFRDSV